MTFTVEKVKGNTLSDLHLSIHINDNLQCQANPMWISCSEKGRNPIGLRKFDHSFRSWLWTRLLPLVAAESAGLPSANSNESKSTLTTLKYLVWISKNVLHLLALTDFHPPPSTSQDRHSGLISSGELFFLFISWQTQRAAGLMTEETF